jgi:mycoredoxin
MYNTAMADSTPNPKLIIYGHDYCGQARVLSRALDQKKIEYEWRDIYNGDSAWTEELRGLARGYLSVPTVIFPDGKVMVEPWPDEVVGYLGREQKGLMQKLVGFFKPGT